MLAHAKCLLPALLALLLAVSPPQAQEPSANPNVRFGMPADAKADRGSRETYLIERPQYVLSYNAKNR
jgi:endonuclease G, mitochondrial